MRLCYPVQYGVISYATTHAEPILKPSKTMRYLCELTAKVFGISYADLTSVRHLRQFADARAVVCHFAYTELKMSLKKIGSHLNRNHATIITAKRKCNDLVHTDKKFLEKFLEVKSKMV